jgi:selenocysteine-specific elongation factor
LRVSDRPAETASAGDRCAVNLTGVDIGQIQRGAWLVDTGTFAPTRNVVIELTVTGDLPRPVRHWLPVHAYLATSHAEGHVALLESPALGRSEHALVELVLDEPLHAKHGDRILLRDHGLERTVGGGRVVDIAAPTRARRDPTRLARLHAQTAADSRTALLALLAIGDVDVEMFRRTRNLMPSELEALLTNVDAIRVVREGREFAIERERWQQSLATLRAQIAAYHNAAPHSAGIKSDQLRRLKAIPDHWLDTALAALVESGEIHDAAGHFHVPGHRPRLPPEDMGLLTRIEALLDDAATLQNDSASACARSMRSSNAWLDSVCWYA